MATGDVSLRNRGQDFFTYELQALPFINSNVFRIEESLFQLSFIFIKPEIKRPILSHDTAHRQHAGYEIQIILEKLSRKRGEERHIVLGVLR